jgi:hypothetical protein
MDLAQALASEPPLKWVIGRVTAITGSTFSMSYRGGTVTGVAAVGTYVPKVGDVVHLLSSDQNGMIAIGANNQAATVPVTPPPPVPITVAPLSAAVYQVATATWTDQTGPVPRSGQLVAVVGVTVLAAGAVAVGTGLAGSGSVNLPISAVVTTAGSASGPGGSVTRSTTATITASGTVAVPPAAVFPNTGVFPDTGRLLRI